MSEKIKLWSTDRIPAPGTELNREVNFQPRMETFLLEDGLEHPMILIFPGGGYNHFGLYEGTPVAERFNRLGFHACVCYYRLAPAYHYPAQAEDALRAIRIVKSKAAEWKIKKDALIVLGFSAGGHLACSTGIIWDEVECGNGDETDRISARPDGMILGYPVITALPRKEANLGSFQNLLGSDDFTDDELRTYSWDFCVRKDTPPAFLWHTAEDSCVPVHSSLSMAEALRKFRIPFELHVFPHGDHGLGLADGSAGGPVGPEEIRIWPELAAAWIRKNF